MSSSPLSPILTKGKRVGLKPLGKASAQHAIESVVESASSPYTLFIRLENCGSEAGSDKFLSRRRWAKIYRNLPTLPYSNI